MKSVVYELNSNYQPEVPVHHILMLWTAKLTGKQPLRLTEGSTEILIISNVCVLPSTLTPNEKLKVLLKVGGTNSSEKHLVA
jgi:hypothetical protein